VTGRDATRALHWVDDAEFTVGDTTFVATPAARFPSTAERFCLVKRPDLVAQYVEMLAWLRPRRILELGIFAGGSTAFLAATTQPEKLVALDIKPDRVDALDEFVTAHGFEDSVRAYYGVDQADRARLREIVTDEYGNELLDLVIDDASHDLDLTRESFNALFPFVRPGGVFIIEDWSWAHIGYGLKKPDDTPLTKLVFEIVMACPSRPGLVSSVAIDHHWALIRRGDGAIDPDTFDISTCYSERGQALLAD
jgi:predicted O-methyltransferase YrrM